MQVVIIEFSDDIHMAEFLTDTYGIRLVFDDAEYAEEWLMKNAKKGVEYKLFSGDNP